jgi:uncharacterized cupin superfamily protein
MTNPISDESDRRTALLRLAGLAAAPVALPMLASVLGADGPPLISAAQAAANPGALAMQGDLVHISAAEARTSMAAEWFTGDVDNTGGPFRTAASKDAFAKAPAEAARYEAKLYNFPTGSLRTLTFKKGGPIQHLITFETEIFVLAGSATLTPIPGHPGKPITVSAGDALFLPSGYLNSPKASDDFVVLLAYVGRTVREAKKSIITAKQAVVSEIAQWNGEGGPMQATKSDEIRKAPKDAHRLTVRRYAGDGNTIFGLTLRGGRGNTTTRTGSDHLVYVVKGRVRRKEGDQTFELAAGDCTREKVGNAGYWEPLEETVCVATEAPFNPGMLPPVNT